MFFGRDSFKGYRVPKKLVRSTKTWLMSAKMGPNGLHEQILYTSDLCLRFLLIRHLSQGKLIQKICIPVSLEDIGKFLAILTSFWAAAPIEDKVL